ncbi:MAG: protease inhibitor I42 family protein [Candidatus Omnitrophota bacterium]
MPRFFGFLVFGLVILVLFGACARKFSENSINPNFALAKFARRADRLNPNGFNRACRGNPAKISNAKCGIKLTEQDDGCIVRMGIGGKLDLVLAGNPTTGYGWETTSLDSAIVREIGGHEFKPDNKAIGSGGRVTLHFEGVGAGRAQLKLVYRRPWEKDVEPLDVFEITVVVRSRLKKMKE